MLRWLTFVGALSLPVRSARAVDVFLAVADSEFHSVEMFDPYDGTYRGRLLSQNDGLFRPINAVLGPDGAVYVSGAFFDTVNYYDPSGTLLGRSPTPAMGWARLVGWTSGTMSCS